MYFAKYTLPLRSCFGKTIGGGGIFNLFVNFSFFFGTELVREERMYVSDCLHHVIISQEISKFCKCLNMA